MSAEKLALPLPPNPLCLHSSPADIAHNVSSVLTFLSWVDIEREAIPNGSQFGHSLILETLISALDHLENLVVADQTGKARREVTP